MSLAIVEDLGRCPAVKAGARCLRIAKHQSACRFFDKDAEALWQAIADLMGSGPVRYSLGGVTRAVWRCQCGEEIQHTCGAGRRDTEGGR